MPWMSCRKQVRKSGLFRMILKTMASILDVVK
jgi:hypothetical protein